MQWLIPRPNRFKEANPDVELRFNMSHGPIDFARNSVSLAICLPSIEPPKGFVRTDVANEWIVPVCSPEYLRHKRVASVEDLARARLTVSRIRPTAWADCGGHSKLELHVDELLTISICSSRAPAWLGSGQRAAHACP